MISNILNILFWYFYEYWEFTKAWNQGEKSVTIDHFKNDRQTK